MAEFEATEQEITNTQNPEDNGVVIVDPSNINNKASINSDGQLLVRATGSENQPIQQTSTNYNLKTELAVGGSLIDPRLIRSLTTGDSVNLGGWFGSSSPTLGQKISAQSIPVVLPSDASSPDAGIQQLVDTNQMYCIAVDLNMASSSTDNPLILLRNPLGSGKKIYIFKIQAGTTVTNVSVEFKVFGNPTVTSNGTSITAVSRNIGGGAPTATALVTSIPTISANGSGMSNLSQGQNSTPLFFGEDFSMEIQPGSSLLFTGSPSSNNRNAAITFIWLEK